MLGISNIGANTGFKNSLAPNNKNAANNLSFEGIVHYEFNHFNEPNSKKQIAHHIAILPKYAQQDALAAINYIKTELEENTPDDEEFVIHFERHYHGDYFDKDNDHYDWNISVSDSAESEIFPGRFTSARDGRCSRAYLPAKFCYDKKDDEQFGSYEAGRTYHIERFQEALVNFVDDVFKTFMPGRKSEFKTGNEFEDFIVNDDKSIFDKMA